MISRFCSILFVASIAGLAPAAASAQENAARPATAIAEARRLIDQGQARAAIEKLKAVGDPISVDVAHLIGVAYYHADDHVRAIEQLTAVLGKLPEGSVNRREAMQILGLSHFIVGHFTEAVPFLEATRVWAADNLELGYVLGQTYVQVRQPDRARATFARTFGVAADSAAAHLVAAQMMIRLNFEDFAEAELTRAIEKDPKLPQAHVLLGQLAMFRGRLTEAITLTEREIALNPGNAMALAQLGDALVRQSKWDEAVVALQKSIWLNPFYSAPYILLGKAYMKKEQPATAEGMLSRAIQYDPNNRAAHYLLGQLFQQMGRVVEAKREFEIAERLQGQLGR
jgi:tetratricopeptide (TPR) repeat protein